MDFPNQSPQPIQPAAPVTPAAAPNPQPPMFQPAA
ncbi:MAG: hypothetical protein ACD_43C00285G0002, partial [uncultured bacterium]